MHTQQSYRPSDEILQKYARLLVRFGLRNTGSKKLEKGASVRFVVPEEAKPMYYWLQHEILAAGYNPIGVYLPSDEKRLAIKRDFYKNAKQHQLAFSPDALNSGMTKQMDGTIRILPTENINDLVGIPAKKIMEKMRASTNEKKERFAKVDAGELNWTLGLYATDASAAEAGLTMKQAWDVIIDACYLDTADPVREWKRIDRTVQKTAQKLTNLQIQSVHMVGDDMDITIGIGSNRAWHAGGGCNVPSYEVFTSPDYRQTNGWIHFSEPLLHYGQRIEGIELHFKDGVVTKATATKNEKMLKEMLKALGANRLGEFSLTDGRLSCITTFMAETLYDENVGGRYGNTHVAVGSAYRDCYNGDGSKFTDAKWDKLGYNNSVVHTDIVSTTDRTVTATLADGSERVIYKDGKFTI
jgi:aminopeptidase